MYPPLVAITAPGNNSDVSGDVNVSATDNVSVSVSNVRLYAGNALVGTDFSSPYLFNRNPDNANEGDAAAYDGVSDAVEGAGDTDQDGVPDYLDSIDNPAVLQGLGGGAVLPVAAEAGVVVRWAGRMQ
ncbi:MAG: Ig-like domain-containing protein [Pseudomonadota bacterium]